MMLWNTLIFACISSVQAAGLSPKKYVPLPLGKISPAGWLQDQLQVQVNGLAGHEHEFYNYVAKTDWLGGDSLYSDLEEAGSYWFNGIVATAVVSNSSELQSRAHQFLDYVLDHQDSAGWLGPEVFNTSKPRYLWGRYPFLLGAIQMAEAYPNTTDKVVTSLYKFVNLSNSMLKNGTGLEEWSKARWFEFGITLQWLYDFYPNGQETLLLETMQLLRSTGVDWEQVFSEEYFPTTPTENIDNPIGNPLIWHGVNVAEGLKAAAVTYRFTGNQSSLDSALAGWDRLFEYHGRPSGVFGADEYLAGKEAIRGSELCLVVEFMFSGSYLYQVVGDTKFADKVEKAAYNALPATLTGDMWSRQYLQQQNQIAAKNMNPDPFPRDGSYSNVFGLEPNYPCCTVNFPQGWPKFISNAFVTTADQKSLVHVYLGPFNTVTTLADNNPITVNIDTLYPFSDTIKTTITAAQPFTYYVRIPSWVSSPTIAVNGAGPTAISATNGLYALQAGAGTTSFVLQLPSEITTESRLHGAIAVHRGPFTYAFDIERSEKVLATNAQESHAMDLEFDPTGTWQYAIDTSSLQFTNSPPAEARLPSPIFDSGLPPMTISASACTINWSVAGDLFASSPPENPVCTGSVTNITLWPFGATKLRIGEFPVFTRNGTIEVKKPSNGTPKIFV